MIKLFLKSRKKNGAAEPASTVEREKRTYVRLLEFRCRGKLIHSAKTDTLGATVRIGRAPE